MTVDIKAVSTATSAAAGTPAPFAVSNDMPVSGANADGEPASGSPDACFAALIAWLMQVPAAPEQGGAAESVSADAPAGEAPAARPLAGRPLPLPLGLGSAADAEGLAPGSPRTGGPSLARVMQSIAAAQSTASTNPDASAVLEPAASLTAAASESSGRQAPPIDLSFLNAAPAPTPAREPSAAPGTGPAEPRLQFAAEIGQRVVTMVEHGVHDARLRVHPEHLGPIEIRVRLDGDNAQVTFHSAHAAVRDALTDAVPRLRELLGAAGFGLDHVDIGAGDSQWAGTPYGRAEEAADPASSDSAVGASIERDEPERAVAMTRGLVDTFA